MRSCRSIKGEEKEEASKLEAVSRPGTLRDPMRKEDIMSSACGEWFTA